MLSHPLLYVLIQHYQLYYPFELLNYQKTIKYPLFCSFKVSPHFTFQFTYEIVFTYSVLMGDRFICKENS